jgi:hypothetical protein
MSGIYSEGVIYYGTPQVTAWQGLRPYTSPNQYMLVGSTGNNGTLFIGDISTSEGSYYNVSFPGALGTSVYGSDLVSDDVIRMVGSIKYASLKDAVDQYTLGFMYQGPLNELNKSSNYVKYDFPAVSTYLHSTAGDLIVVS